MKEFELPYESFIGGWFMPEEVCDDVLSFYNKNKTEAREGRFGGGTIDKSHKESFDLSISANLVDPSHPIGRYRQNLQLCLLKYLEKYPEVNEQNSPFNVNGDYNIQYYPPNGGFKVFHWERQGPTSATRVLVFMTYLNDVQNGGTEFKYQKIITPAKKGLTLLWPTDFTHSHRGVVANTDKYIVTGWYTFT